MKKRRTTNHNNLEPAEVVTPGDILKEELAARGWTQKVFAEIIGKPLQSVNEIIRGKKSITPETAKLLGAALGTSAELWLNLEANYRLKSTRITERERDVSRKARLYSKFPINELIKRGLIKQGKSVDELERSLSRLFKVRDVNKIGRGRIRRVLEKVVLK